MTKNDLPLGRSVDYPTRYAPDVLRAISRDDNRAALDIADPLPFIGQDIWNAWELTWLGPGGRPMISALEIVVPASSPCIVESKSLKLYLNSFAMSEFASADHVKERISEDLSATIQAPVSLALLDQHAPACQIVAVSGESIDKTTCAFDDLDTATARLRCESNETIEEELYSELFRSLCPVTAQPDFATISIRYRGAKIDRGLLLSYLVAFREHQDFHEACVERIFVDLQHACAPDAFCVSARFLRRGGVDINPWRSSGEIKSSNVRQWRQ